MWEALILRIDQGCIITGSFNYGRPAFAEDETFVVFAQTRFELIPGASIPASFKPELLQGSHPTFMTEVLMTRRALFERIGNFPEQYRISSDMEWLTLIFDHNIPTHMLPDLVLTKRIHANNLSGTPSSGREYKSELLHIFRGSILRKRQAKPTP